MKRKTEVYEGEVYEVDPEKKTVRFLGEFRTNRLSQTTTHR